MYSLSKIMKIYLKRFWRDRQKSLWRRTPRRRRTRRKRTDNIVTLDRAGSITTSVLTWNDTCLLAIHRRAQYRSSSRCRLHHSRSRVYSSGHPHTTAVYYPLGPGAASPNRSSGTWRSLKQRKTAFEHVDGLSNTSTFCGQRFLVHWNECSSKIS